MKALQALAIGDAVEGENIDKKAVRNVAPLHSILQKESVFLPHLCPIEGCVGFGRKLLQLKILTQQCGGLTQEFGIVLAEHTEIHIVVPRQDVLPKVDTNSRATNGKEIDINRWKLFII